MSDQATSVQDLKEALRRFVAERQWEKFHSPKNLAMGLAVEAAELMEHFLWVKDDASWEVVRDSVRLSQVRDEIADVAGCLFCLCNTLGIDLSSSIESKLKKNARKYPAEQYRGRLRWGGEGGRGMESGES